jgi:hypothetical protein
LLACSSKREPLAKPEPPDMRPLVGSYDAPAGALDEASMRRAAESAADWVARLASAVPEQPILDALSSALREVSEPKSEGAPPRRAFQSEIEGEGWLRATRICNGWGPEPAPDPENGKLELTATFSERGPDPVVWGGMHECKYLAESAEIQLRGELRVWIGEGLGFAEVGSQPPLLDLAAVAVVDGRELELGVDFRVDPGKRSLELRAEGNGGDVIVLIGGGEIVGVRAKNGDFTCEAAARRCSTETGISVAW